MPVSLVWFYDGTGDGPTLDIIFQHTEDAYAYVERYNSKCKPGERFSVEVWEIN